jgi:hypothetical protein
MVLAELVPHDLAHEEDLGQTKVVIEQVILRDLIVMAMELGFIFLIFSAPRRIKSQARNAKWLVIMSRLWFSAWRVSLGTSAAIMDGTP